MQKSPLFLLRNRTGIAYNLCREALNKHNDNVEEAEAWLKAKSLTHGYQRATKLGGRSTKEGLICLAIPESNRFATLVQLNCETDFVARNQIFKDFAIELTQEVAQASTNGLYQPMNDLKQIEAAQPADLELKSFKDKIAPLISKLGENIKLTKALQIRVTKPHDDVLLFGQIHAKSACKYIDKFDISAGRFASIVALKSLKANYSETSSLKLIGNRLCQHVIGYSPQYLELPDNIKKNLIEEEKKRLEKSANDENDESSDTEDQNLDQNNRDDWPSMMDQTLIMSDSEVVRDYCERNQVNIIYFDRFECG